eukprot:TRINITY_DN37915_c0_g2_i2.p1 TRINITY_DN37915_c0_g2~~TRINITY_DN37915_c0_g2_i2.p1  ORF type:complete len:194 (-),score=28.32 TRINITY_DN37915_c0_g2_i2:389-970(-)
MATPRPPPKGITPLMLSGQQQLQSAQATSANSAGGSTSALPSPRWHGLYDIGSAPPGSSRGAASELPATPSSQSPGRMPVLQSQPRAAGLICPSHGLLRELTTQRKVRAVDLLLNQLREDTGRFKEKEAHMRGNVDRMLESIEKATFITSHDARGVATIHHGAMSPLSEDMDAEQTLAAAVLSDAVLSASMAV